MKSFIAIFTAILAGYAAAAAVGKGVERDDRILIQDNYYTLVSKLESQGTEIATLKTQQDQLKPEIAVLKSQHGKHIKGCTLKYLLCDSLGKTRLMEEQCFPRSAISTYL